MMIDTTDTDERRARGTGRQKKKQESSLCTESGSGGGGGRVVVVSVSVASVFTTYKLTLPNRKAERRGSSRRFDRVRERETVSSTWMEAVCETKYCQSIKGTARNTARASVRTDRASEERVGRQDVFCAAASLALTGQTVLGLLLELRDNAARKI